MSASPSKTEDVEHLPEAASPENSDTMNHADEAAREMAYSEFEVKEQDRWLPIANVARIMKAALPENAKIAKEAKECMQECVSEFISFITSEASEKCQQEKRKTVNGEDILFAMTSLGFENYAEALKIYLSKYRESARSDNPRGQNYVIVGGTAEAESAAAAAAAAVAASTGTGTEDGLDDGVGVVGNSNGNGVLHTQDFAFQGVGHGGAHNGIGAGEGTF